MMTSDAMSRHYGTLSGQERFTLVVEAMARGDQAEERRLDDACPFFHYRAEDQQYRGRMRHLGVLAMRVAMELRERLAFLRMAASFSTHGHDLCDAVFGKLMQATYMAGRDRGRWEAGAPELPKAERYSQEAVAADPELCQDLKEVAECASLGTDKVAAVIREAAGELHASEVLTRWEGFGRLCRRTLGTEPITVMRAWGLMHEDPGEEVQAAYASAEADEAKADEWAYSMAGRWRRHFGTAVAPA